MPRQRWQTVTELWWRRCITKRGTARWHLADYDGQRDPAKLFGDGVITRCGNEFPKERTNWSNETAKTCRSCFRLSGLAQLGLSVGAWCVGYDRGSS